MINPTVVRITLRGLLGRRRFLLLLPLPLLVVGLALLADLIGARPVDWVSGILIGLGVAVVLPVLALIIAASVLGSEIDDGTVVHILAKPLPRREIICSKLLVAVVVTFVAVGPALLLGGALAEPAIGLGLLVGAAAGAFAYAAVFLALSLLTRRPVLIGLVYVLVWEGLLTNLLSGAQVLSIQQYVITIADQVAGSTLLTSSVSLPVALAMTAVVTVGATVLATDRLRSFAVAGT
ncbi:ABC transporter permease subunit [Natronosporangium hydrolyticum]|uniref:ABC transporter permease subunit n=1 Tax=Natronosporangium hydrolyticum TaxID=2811111 RepID=A0A895YE84_9ACTN|nr:ABC transporter permease subunit [Natronosporangium hydrolyticum]QSB14475.1 ABC transporter permease subunit [Natronosporangium hydrolyticum]